MSLLHTIHIASSGDLSSLRTDIDDAYTSGAYTLHEVQDRLGREYNKRCFALGATPSLISPYDAGLRPTSYSISSSDLLLIDGGDLILIDGDDMILI